MSKTLRHPPINDTPTNPTRATSSQVPVTPPTLPVQAIVARDEASLDDALGQTFPASDPVSELPASAYAEKDLVDDGIEQALDAAVAMTFPASDPVAISFARVSPKASASNTKSCATPMSAAGSFSAAMLSLEPAD